MPPKQPYKDFEGAIARLEEITSDLESGELTLEKSISLYTEGVEIAGLCNKKLVEAEGQISKLTRISEKFQLDKFSEEEDA